MSYKSYVSSNELSSIEEDTEKRSSTVEVERNSPEDETKGMAEGGTRGWLTIAGVFLIQFSTFGYNISFGAYQGLLCQVLSDKILNLSNRPPYDDSWDPASFIISQENQWYQVFLSHGIGTGLASGIVYIPTLAVVSHHFKNLRALAMGIVAAGTAAGAAVHPIILNHFFHSKIGFHNGVRISAGINTVCFILANLMMRTNPSPKTTTKVNVPLMSLFRDPAYNFMVFASILSNFAMFFPGFFIQLSAVLRGIDRGTAFYYISMLNGTSVLGRTLVPLLGPKVGVINLNIICASGIGICIFCLSAVNSTTGYILFAVFFGFISGANVAIVAPAVASLSERVEEIGARMGVAFALSGFAALFATPVSGALLTADYHWDRPIIFSGTCAIASAAAVLAARFFVVKRVGSHRV
ncbi:hypothetical protein NP233_g943 [Leucocoprinus birnbaumii]|uniref:Major facilitator superfamily (MFS) profile domain-containing protein n=1 Tax=Leucocoprinus birnbaumii TaxID=56174 RepID=A0AAD5YZZ7_9AGAR|nr:hypothetical protein NP233_g943 [Leucocoprinus birnbaumii]